jgi:tetratricopeptide (TPR) repeat protein
VLTKQGDIEAAREFLHQQPTQTNQQRVQLILAEAYLLRDAKRVEDALDVVQDGLDKLPNDPELLYQRALLAEKLGRNDLLESSLRKLIRVKPEYAHAYNALGYSFADRNERLPEAYTLIQKALSLAPDDFYIMDSMGWVLYRQGKYEEALSYLQRAYSGRPDPEIAAHLGEVLWASGKHDEARKLLQDALAKAPTNETLQQTVQRFKP